MKHETLNMKLVKAVFFDAGETLIFRNPSIELITQSYLKRNGYKTGLNKLRTVMKQCAIDMKPIVKKGVMNDSDKWDHYMKRVFAGIGVNNNKLMHEVKYRLKCGTSFRLYPDVRPAIKKLRKKGLYIGVISNAPSVLMEIFDRLKITDLFDSITISENEGCEKPNRRIFDRAAKKSGFKNSECVYIGDNYIADIEGSYETGMKPIWLLRESKNAHFSFTIEDSDIRCPKIKNLKRLVDIIEMM